MSIGLDIGLRGRTINGVRDSGHTVAGNGTMPKVPWPVDDDRSTLATLALWMQVMLIVLAVASLVAGTLFALWFFETGFAPSFP